MGGGCQTPSCRDNAIWTSRGPDPSGKGITGLMIRFAVFDDDGPAREYPLRHAYLVGKEDLSVPGAVSFEDGFISCTKHNPDAVSLALQVDAGACGRITLQTCLLPDREDPYCLDLELARRRIMLFLNKLEEWSFSALPADHPVMTQFEEARSLFTQALTAPNDRKAGGSPEQAKLARRALCLGIEASEGLAILQAERELATRYRCVAEKIPLPGSRAAEAIAPQLGCIVHNEQFADPLQRIISKSFDFISCPMSWRELEREEGRQNFTPTDRWVEWAVRKAKLPVVGGPIIDFSARHLPQWLYIWEHDYKTLRELTYEHIKSVVTRYRRGVSRWVVCSGLNVNSDFNLRLEEIIDLTRLSVLTVRKLHPSASIVVEINHPFGEHGTHVDRSLSPVLYASLVKESGIHVDAFGLRIQMGDGEAGHSSRDLMEVSALLDIYSQFDKPIHITALGAPSVTFPGPAPSNSIDSHSKIKKLGAESGQLAQPWSPVQQAHWMTRLVAIAFGKPYVESLAWQALYDTADSPEMREGGLISSQGRAKPALKRIKEISSALRSRSLPSKLPPVVEAQATASVTDE